MTLRGPSTIFPTINGLLTLTREIDWPDLVGDGGDILSDGVEVTFGELTEQPTRETFALTGHVDDDIQEWDGLGAPSKRSQFTTVCVAATVVPLRTAEEAWARLRAICETFENTLRDPTTGNPQIPDALALLGVYSWKVAAIATDLWPEPDVGFVASATISVLVKSDF